MGYLNQMPTYNFTTDQMESSADGIDWHPFRQGDEFIRIKQDELDRATNPFGLVSGEAAAKFQGNVG